MSTVKVVTIVNCKKASIRKTPWIPLHEKEIVAEKKFGDSIEIDPSKICYDWKNRKFYKVVNSRGWIHEGVIDYSGGDQ